MIHKSLNKNASRFSFFDVVQITSINFDLDNDKKKCEKIRAGTRYSLMTDDRSSFNCWWRCRRKTEFASEPWPPYIFIGHHPRCIRLVEEDERAILWPIHFRCRPNLGVSQIAIWGRDFLSYVVGRRRWRGRRAPRHPGAYINNAFVLSTLTLCLPDRYIVAIVHDTWVFSSISRIYHSGIDSREMHQ